MGSYSSRKISSAERNRDFSDGIMVQRHLNGSADSVLLEFQVSSIPWTLQQ